MGTKRYEWATDKSRFGMKLLEKMGWKEGKGLGREEDGRVETIKPQRKGTETGAGAPTAAENAWRSPGILASGLNDVLTRLTAVGEVIDSKSVIPNNSNAKTKEVRSSRSARGFYERRRARKNVNGYSQSELREIFGDMDSLSAQAYGDKAEPIAFQASVPKTETIVVEKSVLKTEATPSQASVLMTDATILQASVVKSEATSFVTVGQSSSPKLVRKFFSVRKLGADTQLDSCDVTKSKFTIREKRDSENTFIGSRVDTVDGNVSNAKATVDIGQFPDARHGHTIEREKKNKKSKRISIPTHSSISKPLKNPKKRKRKSLAKTGNFKLNKENALLPTSDNPQDN